VRSLTERITDLPADPSSGRRPSDLLAVRVFLVALSALLVGYMFMGRGFAHVGRPPIYVGEVVLLIGLISTGIAFVRLKLRLAPSRIVWLLLAFMLLGVARTIPYLGVYGIDALRDAVLWGYGVFALMLFVLADRALVLGAMRLYGWVVPVFALWLPICWNIFVLESQNIDPNRPGSFIPLVFFKSGDMAAHVVGSIAFLLLGMTAFATARGFVGRTIVAIPLVWALFLTGTTSRGALLAWIAGLAAVAFLAQRSRNWIAVLVATAVLVVGLVSPGVLTSLGQPIPSPTPMASEAPPPSGVPTPIASEGPSPAAVPTLMPTPTPTPTPTPEATPDRRSQDIGQLVENLMSVFTSSSVSGLDGTKNFRLAWWKAIVGYTVFGQYFWDGKGFGVNLAEADGFQPTADSSLRSPHNSHITALARMGVPGFVLWVLIQGSFGVGLLRSTLAHRRAGDTQMAVVGGWILAYWTAMMVVTSFDPYLEGPQGGIWLWTLFGLGLVVMRLTPQRSTA
jgi:hypothetical protein